MKGRSAAPSTLPLAVLPGRTRGPDTLSMLSMMVKQVQLTNDAGPSR